MVQTRVPVTTAIPIKRGLKVVLPCVDCGIS